MITVSRADFAGPALIAFLHAHLDDMTPTAPPESRHALDDARSRGTTRVSLETGSMKFFAAARALYRRAGFVDAAPFGDYREDPHSVYLTKML